MKLMRTLAILAAIVLSLAALPRLQALPYFGLELPQTPPAPSTPAVAAVPAMASLDVMPEPPAPQEPRAPRESRDDKDRDTYVLSAGDVNIVNGHWDMNLDSLRDSYGRTFFWFRRDGHAYVVRDAATIHDLIDLFRPQSDLGREQGALGRKQGVLGQKQGEIGRRQGEIGREQGRLGVELSRLAMGNDDDDPSSVTRRLETERRQREFSRKQSELGKEQSELGRQQSRLGEEQSKLGVRQAALSREIERKLQPLLDEMIRKGFAEEARR